MNDIYSLGHHWNVLNLMQGVIQEIIFIEDI